MGESVRAEAEVFADLAGLTREPGYIHAIANLSYRDNFIVYRKVLKASHLQKLYRTDRLIRTELTTLLGLLARGPIDFAEPDEKTLEAYIVKTDRLMQELHDAIGEPMFRTTREALVSGQAGDADIGRGEALREPIFYGGESAFGFQYRDLAVEKYRQDDAWLSEHKGFTICQGQVIAQAMCRLLDVRAAAAFAQFKVSKTAPKHWLQVYEQSPEDIAAASGLPLEVVKAFLAAFTLSLSNAQFCSVSDFNQFSATPLLRSRGDAVLLFHHYYIYEPLYESPFYWMARDTAYQAQAAAHRGTFTEQFAAQRLETVFGTGNVHRNVVLTQKKGETLGEIDVLVCFADRLIVVQAKSKKLTLEARRGNDNQLRKDFAEAIQDSYNQAWTCSQLLEEGKCRLENASGAEVVLAHRPKEILIVNVVSEHYPALAFQTRQFLQYQTSDVILPPLVMDVFFLDTLAEMLETPLRLLSYARLRIENTDRLMVGHELTALGFHLKRNLWLEAEYDGVMLSDDIAVDLDIAMTVRRDGQPGARTPEGILTRLAGTRYESLLQQIERKPEPATAELGLALLRLGESSARNIHVGLQAITRKARVDRQVHDFSTGGTGEGMTFHCNPVFTAVAYERLKTHCELKKYQQKARRWFGVSVDTECALQGAIVLEWPWEQSDAMERATRSMQAPTPAGRLREMVQRRARVKVGRNEPCPCGSQRKYKKCCLVR